MTLIFSWKLALNFLRISIPDSSLLLKEPPSLSCFVLLRNFLSSILTFSLFSTIVRVSCIFLILCYFIFAWRSIYSCFLSRVSFIFNLSSFTLCSGELSRLLGSQESLEFFDLSPSPLPFFVIFAGFHLPLLSYLDPAPSYSFNTAISSVISQVSKAPELSASNFLKAHLKSSSGMSPYISLMNFRASSKSSSPLLFSSYCQNMSSTISLFVMFLLKMFLPFRALINSSRSISPEPSASE